MSGRQYSIRRRLVAGALAVMILILGGIGIAAHQVAQHESEEIFSARLATSARVLEALVARQLQKATITQPILIALPKELESATGDTPEAYGHPYEAKIAFQVWHSNGALLAKSASAPDVALGPLISGFSKNRINNQVWQVFGLRSGEVWVLAAEKDEVRQEMANNLGMSILAPLAGGGFLMLLAVNLVLSVNMTPLRELADRIAKREPESLAPIELPRTPVELAPIVKELNDLLCRVTAAFEREQRFIDAAAHEIRTPIAALQVHVQNALRARSEQERQQSLTDVLAGLRRTTNLAEQLLTFSRVTAKIDAGKFQPVSLNQICGDVIASQEPLLAQRGQTICLEATEECLVLGDPYKLQRLLQNLIDNASRYGRPQGEIQVSLEKRVQSVVLSVVNDGDPVPEDEIEKIFTPYYRILGHASPGAGLGLAIVKEIAEQHKAEIGMRKKNDQGAIVSVTFPALKVVKSDQ
ncbi:MAG TPA: ATP-binding protein [Noviherbaspirillum sp.]|nr:ATP-binding protein [Noviherbaspirillum sp.]